MFIGSLGKISSILLSVLPDIGNRCRSADMFRGSVNCAVLESSLTSSNECVTARECGAEKKRITQAPSPYTVPLGAAPRDSLCLPQFAVVCLLTRTGCVAYCKKEQTCLLVSEKV